MLDFLVKKVNVSSFSRMSFFNCKKFSFGFGSQAHVCPARTHVTSGVCPAIELLYLTF